MREVSPGEPPKRPNPDGPNDPDVSVAQNMEEATNDVGDWSNHRYSCVSMFLIILFIIK